MQIYIRSFCTAIVLAASISVICQDYYIDSKDKKKVFEYYLHVMDSLTKTDDSTYSCINCIRFMQKETKIQRTGKITYFGRLDFTKTDYDRWTAWYNKHYGIKKFTPQKNYSAINEKVYLNLGGTKQYVEITGESADNPILLFIHGGPGWPQTPFLRYYNAALTKKCILVSWDQRGCGLSYMKDPNAANITLKQIVADAHQLTSYLKNRYHKNKIYLAGYSWGSIVGIKLAQQYPGDYFAYLSISQAIDLNKSIQVSRKWIKEQAVSAKDDSTLNIIHRLEINDTSLCKTPLDCFIKQHDLLGKYHGAIHTKKAEDEIDKVTTFYDDYKKYDWMAGFTNSAYKLAPDMFTDLSQIKEIKIPVYFFVGRHDWTLPASVTEDYYRKLKCPTKEMIWFENSGHELLEEEANLFNNRVLEKIK